MEKSPNQKPEIFWYEIDLFKPHNVRKALWGFIVSHTGHPELVNWLAGFIRYNQINARDTYALAQELLNFSQDHIKYFREYPERFASPLRTIEWGIGDCDDKTIFIACSLRSFRVPVKLKFIKVFTKEGTKWHVLPMAFLPAPNTDKKVYRWYCLESVIKLPMGLDPEILLNRKGVKTQSFYLGDDSVIR